MARPRPTTAPIIVSRRGLGLAGSFGNSAGKICTLFENCVLMNCSKLCVISFASSLANCGLPLRTSSSISSVFDCGFTNIIEVSCFSVIPGCCTNTGLSTSGLVSNCAYVGTTNSLVLIFSKGDEDDLILMIIVADASYVGGMNSVAINVAPAQITIPPIINHAQRFAKFR